MTIAHVVQSKTREPIVNRTQTTPAGHELLKGLREGKASDVIRTLKEAPGHFLKQIRDTELASTLVQIYRDKHQPKEIKEAILSFVQQYGSEIGLTVKEYPESGILSGQELRQRSEFYRSGKFGVEGLQ